MTITEYHKQNERRFPQEWLAMTGSDVVPVRWKASQLPLLYDFLASRGWLQLLPKLEFEKDDKREAKD